MNVAVFIDGANLYKKIKSLGIQRTSKFDFSGFVSSLTGSDTVVFIGYYIGQIRREQGNEKSAALYAGQQRLLAHLRSNIPSIQIELGNIQNHNGTYAEKGVDVKIALDIYKLGADGVYDKAMLISSDTDLLPAIRMVQDIGKEVEYIGFNHQKSIALVKECSLTRLLVNTDLAPFEASAP